MAKKSPESSIYGIVDNSYADDLADRSLNNEVIVPTDTIGWTLRRDLPDHILPDDGPQTEGVTGSHKGGHTHKGDVAGGSDEVTNAHASHERHSLRDEAPTHADQSVREHK
jgi:hypothetical protein